MEIEIRRIRIKIITIIKRINDVRRIEDRRRIREKIDYHAYDTYGIV
jgi:hypothetical protein